MSDAKITAKSKDDIMKGSKSFSMASLFFDQPTKEASWYLYSWCRYCDDRVDFSKAEEISRTVQDLKAETIKALNGQASTEHPWPALQNVAARYNIPSHYALDLIEGFERDALKKPIQDEADLQQYCYGVASAVGLMMCHIMGVSSSSALKHAVALGRAMQMTNIARDIAEDHSHGRLYLPLTWLHESGLNDENYLHANNRAALKTVILKLLKTAEIQYQIGHQGLQYLPLRSAWAVASALRIYRAIGRKIEADVDLSLNQRTVVSKTEKLTHIALAAFDVAGLALKRIFKPYHAIQKIELWRNS